METIPYCDFCTTFHLPDISLKPMYLEPKNLKPISLKLSIFTCQFIDFFFVVKN